MRIPDSHSSHRFPYPRTFPHVAAAVVVDVLYVFSCICILCRRVDALYSKALVFHLISSRVLHLYVTVSAFLSYVSLSMRPCFSMLRLAFLYSVRPSASHVLFVLSYVSAMCLSLLGVCVLSSALSSLAGCFIEVVILVSFSF